MPTGQNNGRGVCVGHQPGYAPLQPQKLFGLVDFALRVDVHPVAVAEQLDCVVHRRLIDAVTSVDGQRFAETKEERMGVLPKVHLAGAHRPAELGRVRVGENA